jgi:acylphosphatase
VTHLAGPVAAFRYLIRGKVQGVGFRWFVARNATRLRVMGYARNLHDGAVEVLAVTADLTALAELERCLDRGPEFAKVESVDKSEISVEGDKHKTFDIM